MPIAVSPRRSVSRLALVIAAAALAAGCSNGSTRFSPENLFAGSTANGASVEQRSLPPLASDPSVPGAQTGTVLTSLADRGWTTAGGQLVEVSAGDTSLSLSQGFGVPVPILMEANGLAAGAALTPGQRIIIPKPLQTASTPLNVLPSGAQTGLGAPPTTLNQQANALASTATGGQYTVQPGDTLFSIARRNGVSEQAIATLNGLPANGTVQLGQTLQIPGGAGAAATSVAPQVAEATPPVTQTQERQVALANPADTVTDATPAPAVQQPERIVADPPKARTAEDFRWPVRGRIIAGFGKQPDGARNDGINLAVPAGTPVRAAESGTVIYAGNELEGYGNLVLVQHDNDWVSAYAHAETITVSRGDKVERGQPIATAGKTGSVDQPQLHFELRRNSRPVDPLPHLAGA